ncbi:hypothetical protein Dimus_001760, partial [Dionaea muscipula]
PAAKFGTEKRGEHIGEGKVCVSTIVDDGLRTRNESGVAVDFESLDLAFVFSSIDERWCSTGDEDQSSAMTRLKQVDSGIPGLDLGKYIWQKKVAFLYDTEKATDKEEAATGNIISEGDLFLN